MTTQTRRMGDHAATDGGLRAVVRHATQADTDVIDRVHRAAFPVEEAASVATLAADLLALPSSSRVLNLVADIDGRVVGHVAFSPVVFDQFGGNGLESHWTGHLLSPLAVAPEFQGNRVGSRLVEHGIERLRTAKTDVLVTYGDPSYYGRFGFSNEAAVRFVAPYALTQPEGWLALLADSARSPEVAMRVRCVAPLQDSSLW